MWQLRTRLTKEPAHHPAAAENRSHQCYVAVVPCVVVHQSGSVGHAGDLVTVVPPGHDAGVLVRVLPQPVISFPEVIQDVARPLKSQ